MKGLIATLIGLSIVAGAFLIVKHDLFPVELATMQTTAESNIIVP